MDKKYLLLRLDGIAYETIVDKDTALSFDDSLVMIRDEGKKNRMVDSIVRVSKSRTYAEHIIVVTHVMGMPGLRDIWVLLPKHTYLSSIWSNYFQYVTRVNEGLTKIPDRYIPSTSTYQEIKHD